MRYKDPRSQNFFLRSRFYLTGSKSEIERKIPRLPSRVRDLARETVPQIFARLARRWRPRTGALRGTCKICTKCHLTFYQKWQNYIFVNFDKIDKIYRFGRRVNLWNFGIYHLAMLNFCTNLPKSPFWRFWLGAQKFNIVRRWGSKI